MKNKCLPSVASCEGWWTFKKIIENLKERNIKFETVEFTDIAISARVIDSSKRHNFDPNNAIKTLIIKDKKGDFFAVITKGDVKIENQKLKEIIKGKWFIATNEDLIKLGLIKGGVCPLILFIPIFIDRSVLELDIWSMGAGSIDKGINVSKQECLGKLSSYKVIKLSS